MEAQIDSCEDRGLGGWNEYADLAARFGAVDADLCNWKGTER
jgi:hypothetical protein